MSAILMIPTETDKRARREEEIGTQSDSNLQVMTAIACWIVVRLNSAAGLDGARLLTQTRAVYYEIQP